MDKKSYSLFELEDLSEKELEGLIEGKIQENDAKYVLGKLLIEGVSDKVPHNEKKGLNWIKEAIKKDHMPSFEYKTYYDIRFEKRP